MFVYVIDLHELIAIFIAVLALFLTIWQAWMTRRHNHKSVRPLLSYETHLTSTTKDFGIYIKITEQARQS